MIKFAEGFEAGADNSELQPERGAPALPDRLTQGFSTDTHRLLGPQITAEDGLHTTTNRLAEHLPVPETNYVPRVSVLERGADIPPQTNIVEKPYATIRGSAKAFAGGTALTGVAAFGTGAVLTGGLAASALAALPIALGGGAALAGLYYGGKLHNLVWKNPKKPDAKEPGFLGTLARGTIAVPSVLAGMLLKH